MSSTIHSASGQGRAGRWLIGLAFLGAVLVLSWAACSGPGLAGQEKVKPGNVTDDLKLVPADTSVFFTVRVADLFGSDLGKSLLPVFGKMPDWQDVEGTAKTFGLRPADIERLTVLPSNRGLVVIVRTRR